MYTCPLRRAFGEPRSQPCPSRRTSQTPATPETPATELAPQTHANDSARRCLHIATTLSSPLGYHALTRLLDAIPDSNDDFGLF